MKRWMKAAAAVLLLGTAVVSQARTDVGVSVEISQPGVFGRVDIGRFPAPPPVVVRAPVIVVPQRQVEYAPEPVYLWVPQDHRRDWRRHCGRYGACGVPVYFVRDAWYQDNVHRGRGRWDERRDDRRDDRRDGRGDGRWDDRRGHDHGRGHD